MNFVTVKESHYQTDLVVLNSRLESEGIECRFKNEYTAQVLNYLPSFLVELQVPEEDVPRVKQILLDTGELLPESVKFGCPECGSQKVKLKLSLIKRIKIFFSAFYVLLGSNVPMDKLFKRGKFICSQCGNEFF